MEQDTKLDKVYTKIADYYKQSKNVNNLFSDQQEFHRNQVDTFVKLDEVFTTPEPYWTERPIFNIEYIDSIEDGKIKTFFNEPKFMIEFTSIVGLNEPDYWPTPFKHQHKDEGDTD